MFLYRLILAIVWPVLLIARVWRGERLADLQQRLGFAPDHAAREGIWLHGASNGELTSARWLVQDLIAARPGLTVLVTSNTVTARQMVCDWGIAGVVASLAPIDTLFANRRLLRRIAPKALISLEAELWPNRFAACAAAAVPVMLLGARMSARSYRSWQRFSGVAARTLSLVTLASAQDTLSGQHLQQLGLSRTAIAPSFDLKAEATLRLPPPDLPMRSARAGWLLAASTHDGEDHTILDAFAQSGFDHLILAPRHITRAASIVALLQSRGLSFGQRSKGEMPSDAPVYLADTMGEMDKWYALCGACIIGGTFVDKGGHTPWEPARFRCAILHGPSVWNFAAPFAELDHGGALSVTAATLASNLNGLTPDIQDRMSAKAALILRAKSGLNDVFSQILDHLDAKR